MVCYQVYLRSFGDSNGDGVGDIPGLIDRLDYLSWLGVEALWVSPFFTSPQVDAGYDVADPTSVDPLFGTDADAARLVDEVHRRGMKLLIEVIPNHVSDQHPWFQAALAGDAAARERFVIRSSAHGPPNNWSSVFGGPAWTRLDGDEWYLHLFDPAQPDLNWNHPDVPAEYARVLRHWFDLGVDGFRVDVAHGLAKPDGLPDLQIVTEIQRTNQRGDIRFNDRGVHEHLRALRAVADEYDDRVLLGEVWTDGPERLREYVADDQFHLVFTFGLTEAPWSADSFAEAISVGLQSQGGAATWVLSNHDIDRHATRFGGGWRGRDRARGAALVQLMLPGVAVVYQGDELGLENAFVPPESRQDPTWRRSGGGNEGRDGVRIPLPWTLDAPGLGFTSGSPWLPVPQGWARRAVSVQQKDPDSTLAFYRLAIDTRSKLGARVVESSEVRDDVLHIVMRSGEGATRWRVACNFGERTVQRPSGTVVLRSGSASSVDLIYPGEAILLR